jgi:autotransporter-associated beta strand protein/parallel beta-helix repeat protein
LVSIDRLTLEGAGKNLYGIEGAGVSRVNVDRVTVRDTGLSGIFLQGLGSTVFNNEMTVTRCTVRGVVNAAGIHFQQATQGVVMENESFNNGTGILLENADHCLVVNNRLEYNATEGVCLQDSKSAKVASNLLLGNPIGVGTKGASTTTASAHFIFRNDIQSATIGISLGQSKDTLYGNSIAAGVSMPLSFASGAVNRVVQVGAPIPAPSQEYFYPPTALNLHTAAVKNGQDRVDISTSATTLSEIQAAYNSARASQPGRVTVLRLTAPVITGDQTLVLQGDTCIVLEGRINLSPGVTAFQVAGTTSAPLSFISISGGTIDGQNTTGRSGMIFTNCSKVLVEGVNLVNFGSKVTRVTGSDVILFAGCKDPCIVDSSTISGGAARGIWTKGITGSSLSGMLFIDNVVSEVNMDGIDFDTATSLSSAFYNLSQNHVRYGVFVEEGAKNVQVVGNTCSGNDIGINVYSYAVGATEQNTLVANVLTANRRGLRFGAADPEPSTGILTRNNFAFNNRIQNTTTLGAVDAQLDGGENYVSQNVLSANILDYGSTSSAVFLNNPTSAALGVDNAALANTDFSSGYLEGNLVGQDGWSVYGTGANGPITVRGGAVELGSGTSYQSVFKPISPYQFGDAASVYIRIDLQVQSASATGNDFFFITRETDSITGQPTGKSYFRLYVRAAGSGFQIGWNPHAETGATVTPAVPTYADTIFQLNTDYQLVLRCDSTAARNNDDTFLYLNPLRADATPLLSRTTWVGNTDEFSASTSTAANRVGDYLNLVLRQPANTPSISIKVRNIVVAPTAKDIGLDWVSEVVPTSTTAGAFANNSSNGITAWQAGPGWTPANPIGGASATIVFNGILSGALTANNDTPGSFMLNAISNSISGAGSLTYIGGTFQFVANGTTNPTLTFANNALVQTFSNNIQVDAELKVSQAGSTATNSILAGPISGVGGLFKSGNGTVLITRNDNTFDGVTTVGAGQVNIPNLGNNGSPSSLGRNATISLGGGTATGTLRWESVASETSDKSIVLGGSTGGGTLDVRGTANILTLDGPISTGTNAGPRTFTLTGQGGATVNGLISGNAGLRVNGSASRTVTLANANNSFSGPATIDGNLSGASYKVQVASIGNVGLNSPLGTNSTINIGTTNNAFNFLVWSNTVAETTDKTVNLAGTAGPALIVNKGPVLLKFTAPVTATGVGTKTFYADQDDANGVTEFAGGIPNSSGGTTALNKNGPGTLILSAVNTFTGGFTLKGGTLELRNAQSLAAGNVLSVPTNATALPRVKVAYAGAGPNLGNLLVLANASIDLGTNPNSQIRFGSATNWTNANIILTITNSSGGGQLYITNTNGVALNQIKSAENSNAIAILNSEGLLTFTNPAPTNSKPVVTAAQAFSVSENAPFATTVGTVVGTDADANPAFSSWTIVSGNTGGVFGINPANGQITVVGTVNFEGTASYALGVTVSDGMETSAVGTVVISVINVPEYSDFFGSSSPTADDNGDGISNLMAYALGATSPNSVVVPPGLNTADPTKLTITALIRINDPKVSVVGEYGLTLGTWETASPIAGVDSSNQAGVVAGVTKWQDFSVLRAPDPKKFLHLKATQSQ